MSNHTVPAAAEGMPNDPYAAQHHMVAICEAFAENADVSLLAEVIDTPAMSLRGVMAKAAALRSFTPAQLRISDVGRALALSIAADLLRDRTLVLTPPIERLEAPRDRDIAEAYSEWLFMERRLLCVQLYPDRPGAEDFYPVNTLAGHFHLPGRNWREVPLPFSRAEAVLTMVGVDLSPASRED